MKTFLRDTAAFASLAMSAYAIAFYLLQAPHWAAGCFCLIMAEVGMSDIRAQRRHDGRGGGR